MQSIIGILVCADDLLGRAGLAAMLGGFPEVVVVAQEDAGVLTAAGSPIDDDRIELIVWDVGWSEMREDLDIAVQAIPVIALVLDEEQAAGAWRAGCRGVLWRNTAEEDLITAVLAVGAGFVVIAPGLAKIVNRPSYTVNEAPTEELTSRETEVLVLVAKGLTNKAIGQRLTISEHTVKFHLNAILTKLNAQSRTEAVVIATRHGLISL